ncbi:DUF4760 domain-containing protein [Sulfurisoma sediminicola]|uniref:Uncharacterized protein n=1 Tax=Sulfurisoma sediminicola TaxID=1381557 RepID=A0A497XG75_9PROT|nr:hypothetical protein [Sulfurisoma sediminicola]RLJ65088.1 hypothetical protein DFR35_1744 [Sulfurisoma sediminicola]
MPLKDQKDFWSTAATIVQIVAVVGGSAFGLYEYLQKDKADHTRDTLSYVDRYLKAPIHDVRVKLDAVWTPREDELIARLKRSVPDYENFVLKTIRDEKLESDIFSLISFLESVEACTRASICDAATARAFFCSDAQAFFQLHFRFIQQERNKRNDPTLAQALEKFVKKDCRR